MIQYPSRNFNSASRKFFQLLFQLQKHSNFLVLMNFHKGELKIRIKLNLRVDNSAVKSFKTGNIFLKLMFPSEFEKIR